MSRFNQLIPVGKKFISPGRTIGEGDFSLMINLSWNIEEIHCNAEYCKKETQFGERILSGPCVLACAAGLGLMTPALNNTLFAPGLRAIAMLGYEEVRFPAPVKPGDTLTVQNEILEVRASTKNPKRGIITLAMTTFNQRQEVVMTCKWVEMLELTE